MQFLTAFLTGGAICVLGQLLIDKTALTPARILTAFVVAGVALGALGLYQPLVDLAGAGASVPPSWQAVTARRIKARDRVWIHFMISFVIFGIHGHNPRTW